MIESSQAVPPAHSPRRRSVRQREALHGYVFMAPAILGLLLFTLGPVIASLALSFTDYGLLTDPEWVGLENYRDMIGEELFWQALRVSTTYSLVSVPLGLVAGLGLAVLLNRRMRGVTLFRSIYYLPTVISGVGVAMLWRWLFNAEFGIINVLLGFVGIEGPAWLTNERWALPALIITSLWGVGSTTLIFLAGLQGIPEDLYEAAEMMGASAAATFRHITLPLIGPAVLAAALLAFTLSIDEFIIAYFTAGAGQSSTTLPMQIYAMIRFGVTPEINAMASLVMLASFVMILAAQRLNKAHIPAARKL